MTIKFSNFPPFCRKCERLYLDIMKREIGRGVPQNANSLVEMSLKLARSVNHNLYSLYRRLVANLM